jgi:hypothetical protein
MTKPKRDGQTIDKLLEELYWNAYDQPVFVDGIEERLVNEAKQALLDHLLSLPELQLPKPSALPVEIGVASNEVSNYSLTKQFRAALQRELGTEEHAEIMGEQPRK